MTKGRVSENGKETAHYYDGRNTFIIIVLVGQKISFMGRQTFYYHFDSKYDLANWIFSDKTTQILDKWITKESWGKSLARALEMIVSDRLFYRKAMKKRDSDFFFSHFYEYCVRYYLRKLAELYGIEQPSKELLFQIRFNCHACTNITRDWLENSCEDSPEAIGMMLYGAMPSLLKGYFTFDVPTD